MSFICISTGLLCLFFLLFCFTGSSYTRQTSLIETNLDLPTLSITAYGVAHDKESATAPVIAWKSAPSVWSKLLKIRRP